VLDTQGGEPAAAAPAGGSGRHEWRRNALALALSLVVALVLGEVLARAFVPQPRSARGIWPGFDEQLREGLFVADSEIGYRPGPQWGPQGRFGFRNGAEYEGRRGTGRNIAVLGDSLVGDDLLGKALRARLAGSPDRVWVAGIAGYTTMQEAMYLERWITLSPDVLVLVFCLNDFGRPMVVVPAGNEWRFVHSEFSPLAEVSPRLFRSSALYRLVSTALVSLAARHQYTPEGVRSFRPSVQAGLIRMQRYAQRLGIPFVVALYPHLVEEEAPWMREAHQQALALFRELGLRHVDVTAAFTARGITTLRKTENDAVHPSHEGQEIAAGELVRAFPDVFPPGPGAAPGRTGER
jgi:hypothetical protein